VEDAPFIAVEMRRDETRQGCALAFRTTMDDWVTVDDAHPLRFEREATDGLKPYVLVRGDLWAKVARPIFYDLVEMGETREIAGERLFGIESAGRFFAMAPAAEIEGL
jgi:uncharacterized protein